MEILDRVLQLNHLPGLKSYVLNYFLRAPFGGLLLNHTTDIVIQPYSAAIFSGESRSRRYGWSSSDVPTVKTGASPDSASLIYYGDEGKEVIIAIKESLQGPWSVTVPYPGMSGYRMLFVNASGQPVRGTFREDLIPRSLLCWNIFEQQPRKKGACCWSGRPHRKMESLSGTFTESGNGAKEHLNALPLPASVDSPTKAFILVFIDHTQGTAYSLEALTAEGFPSPVASTSTQSKDHPDNH